MTTEEKIIEEIKKEYGSVSKMINIVQNKVRDLKKFHGYEGRDGGDTLSRALISIREKYHGIYYKYSHTYPRP